MVRTPTKSCPNLSKLFEDLEITHLAEFLNCRAFERLSWLDKYRFAQGDADSRQTASDILRQEKRTG